MSISSISDFLHRIAAVGVSVFGERVSPSDWQILLALGRGVPKGVLENPSDATASGPCWQSYKALKCNCGLSDDALSRGLRRLVEMGLVDRRNGVKDLRMIHYALSALAEQGFRQMGRLVVMELSELILAMTQVQGGQGRPGAAGDRAPDSV